MSGNNNGQDSKWIPLCSLWKNTDRNGVEYFTGKLSFGTKLIIRPNNFQHSATSPTHIAYIVEDKAKDKNQTKSSNQPMDNEYAGSNEPIDGDVPF